MNIRWHPSPHPLAVVMLVKFSKGKKDTLHMHLRIETRGQSSSINGATETNNWIYNFIQGKK